MENKKEWQYYAIGEGKDIPVTHIQRIMKTTRETSYKKLKALGRVFSQKDEIKRGCIKPPKSRGRKSKQFLQDNSSKTTSLRYLNTMAIGDRPLRKNGSRNGRVPMFLSEN